MLVKVKHPKPTQPQHSPYKAPPKKYGAAAQEPLEPDMSENLNAKGIRRIQQIVGAALYYGRAVDNSILPALSALAGKQTKATKTTRDGSNQLLDYLATHPDATI